MRVIAIDPGESTGYAIGRIEDGELTVEEHGWLPWKAFCLRLYRTQTGEEPFDVVVYETWRLRGRNAKQLTGSDMPSVQCVGICKFCAWLSDARLVGQEPAIKSVIDAMKGGHKAYLPASDVEHNRDALRHLHYFHITNNKGATP